MLFSDLALARRLERAEGYACVRFTESRRRLNPNSSSAAWMDFAGAYAAFNGPDSPSTQSFGFGIFDQPAEHALDVLEQFFFAHDAPAIHEVSPFAGISATDLLCSRGYRPIEISS